MGRRGGEEHLELLGRRERRAVRFSALSGCACRRENKEESRGSEERPCGVHNPSRVERHRQAMVGGGCMPPPNAEPRVRLRQTRSAQRGLNNSRLTAPFFRGTIGTAAALTAPRGLRGIGIANPLGGRPGGQG